MKKHTASREGIMKTALEEIVSINKDRRVGVPVARAANRMADVAKEALAKLAKKTLEV